MDLFIIRHAWAAERDGATYPDDALRPLTDEGRERFAKMVEFLVPRGLRPQLIVTSPMLRCVQTAHILASALESEKVTATFCAKHPEGRSGKRWLSPFPTGEKTRVVERKELLPGGDPKQLFAWTDEHGAGLEQVAWVGHAPDIGFFAALLIGQDDGWINFKKGAIACIRSNDSPDFGRGELQWLVTAKVLGV